MIDLGDVVPLTLQIRDASGVAADATAVTLTIEKPDGTNISPAPTITHTNGTGLYTYDLATTGLALGRYEYLWVATGLNAGTWSGTFTIDDVVSKMLVSLEDVKTHLNVPDSVGTQYDEELRGVIAAATAACADYTGRTLIRTSVTETYSGGASSIILRRTPVQSITSVTENGSAVTAFVLDEDGILYRGTTTSISTWSPGVKNISVTYVAGYADVPTAFRMAVLRMCEHLWQRTQQAPHPALGQGQSSLGQTDESLPRNTFLLPYQVQSWLTPYRAAGF